MKVTIEPTTSEKPKALKVTIEQEGDDLTVDGLVALISAALLAMGFHPDNVRDSLEELMLRSQEGE